MASSKMSMKLLVDTKANKVLFAEAGKEFVDFLFTLLSLPVATIIRLLNKNSMVGSLGSLYDSLESLSEAYMQPNKSKDPLLKPILQVSAADFPLLLTENLSMAKKVYMCGSYHRFIADDPRAICPQCKYTLSTEVPYVGPPPARSKLYQRDGGYVKGIVTYMVNDDLAVKPMSTISGIALLRNYNVKEVGVLEEKVVEVTLSEVFTCSI